MPGGCVVGRALLRRPNIRAERQLRPTGRGFVLLAETRHIRHHDILRALASDPVTTALAFGRPGKDRALERQPKRRIKEITVENLMLQVTDDDITDDKPLFGPEGLASTPWTRCNSWWRSTKTLG